MSKPRVLVTGGAGFIGSHIILELLQTDYEVTAVDNFANSIADESDNAISLKRVSQITGKSIEFVRCDLLDKEQFEELFKKTNFGAVIHLAALKSVGESVLKPLEYYRNNIVGSLNLIELCQKYGVKEFIFSSSATVYGPQSELPIRESAITGQGITNPYGQTKYFIERILFDLSRADSDWNISILRYFNPVGAHPSGLIGEDPRGIPNNLMPFISQVAANRLPCLRIFGVKYDTPDGTGIRDYIHIVDLAKAHVAALNRIRRLKEDKKEARVEIYNVGTGKGYSAAVYCDPSLALIKLGWKAEYGIEEMCRDTWNWQIKNPNGYTSTKA